MTTNNGLPLQGSELTNQTSPGVACELFFLKAPPVAEA